MVVEIKPRLVEQMVHPGLAPVLVNLNQDEILVDGVRVGYVGTQPNAPITLLFSLAEATVHQIRHEVNLRDQAHVPQRSVNVVPEMPEEAE